MIDWTEIILAAGAGILGGIVAIIGYRLFKQKTEMQIETLIDAHKYQIKNNDLQQREIISMEKEILMVRENLTNHKEHYLGFTEAVAKQNEKSMELQMETTQVLAGLKATMEGMKNVFEILIQKNS